MKHLKVLSLCLCAASLSSTLSGCNNLSWKDALKELDKIDFTSVKEWEGINHYGTAYGSYPYEAYDDSSVGLKEDNIFGKSIRPDRRWEEEETNQTILKIMMDPNEFEKEHDTRAWSYENDTRSYETNYKGCLYSLEFDYLMSYMSEQYIGDRSSGRHYLFSTGMGYYEIESLNKDTPLDLRYDEGVRYMNGTGPREISCYYRYNRNANNRSSSDVIYYPNEEAPVNGETTFNYTTEYEVVREGFYNYIDGEGNDDSVIAKLKASGNNENRKVDNVSVKKNKLSWRVTTGKQGRYTVTLHHDDSYLTAMYIDYTAGYNDANGNKIEVTARCIYQEIDWTDVKDKAWTEDEE